jgi:hypothetical protein
MMVAIFSFIEQHWQDIKDMAIQQEPCQDMLGCWQYMTLQVDSVASLLKRAQVISAYST